MKKFKKNKSSSSQAGGPSQKVERLGEITRGCKHATQKPQMIFKTILEFEKDE